MPHHYFLRVRDPLEIMVCGLFLVSCVGQIASGEVPNAIAALLPTWFRFLWLGMISAGCVATLVGVFWPGDVTGMFIEQVGLMTVGSAILFYGLSLLYVAPTAFVSGMTIAIGLSFLGRWLILRHYTSRLPKT